MALIACLECGGKVSDEADKCPHCGYSVAATLKAHLSTNGNGNSSPPGADRATDQHPKTVEQVSPELHRLLDGLRLKLEAARSRRFVFMLVGRAGVGKSSTINSLLGKEVAKVGDYYPTTFTVERYDTDMNDVQFSVVDTPGLCDGIDADGDGKTRDMHYLELMRKNVSQIDVLWFVTQLNETRLRADEKTAIRLVTKAFKPEVWKRAVIVFTHANDSDVSTRFVEALTECSKRIRVEIEKYTDGDVAADVPTVAIDNKSKVLPDGNRWKGELFTQTFMRVSREGLLTFTLGTASLISQAPRNRDDSRTRRRSRQDLDEDGPSEKRRDRRREERYDESDDGIELTDAQASRMGKRLREESLGGYVAAGATGGALVGAALGGPVGAAIGAACGAAGGAVVGFFRRVFG